MSKSSSTHLCGVTCQTAVARMMYIHGERLLPEGDGGVPGRAPETPLKSGSEGGGCLKSGAQGH